MQALIEEVRNCKKLANLLSTTYIKDFNVLRKMLNHFLITSFNNLTLVGLKHA